MSMSKQKTEECVKTNIHNLAKWMQMRETKRKTEECVKTNIISDLETLSQSI